MSAPHLLSASGHPVNRAGYVLSAYRRVSGLVAAAFDVPLLELGAVSRRSPAAALARQASMYLAHVALGLSYNQVGRLAGRDRTTVAYACRQIEERRDDVAFDAVLTSLEEAVAALRGSDRAKDRS